MMINLRRLAAFGVVLGSFLSGLIFLSARSDFRARGCPGIPRAEWEATVNCLDGSLAQWVFGLTSAALIGLALLIWPGRRTGRRAA